MTHSCYGLCLRIEQRRNKTYILVAGELDMSNVSVLTEAFSNINPQTQAGVVVDIGRLDFLGACGINAMRLAKTRFALNGCPLIIRGAKSSPRRALIAGGAGSALIEALPHSWQPAKSA